LAVDPAQIDSRSAQLFVDLSLGEVLERGRAASLSTDRVTAIFGLSAVRGDYFTFLSPSLTPRAA
jgi:hypothetical protein